MEFLKKISITFVLVLSGITVSTTIFVTLFFPDAGFTVLLLWEIIGMSAVCSLGNLIFYSNVELSKKQMIFRHIIHFIYINAIVLGGAILWKWVAPGYLSQVAVMLLLITIVYSAVMYVNLRIEKKTAEDLNQRLSEYNKLSKS